VVVSISTSMIISYLHINTYLIKVHSMLFKQNKYTNWYFQIINLAKSRSSFENQYQEKHHIIPKSLGGTDAHDNLVKLTAREHYVCHRLLVRMCILPKHKKSMAWGLHLMMHRVNPYQDRYLPKSKTYELVREEFKRIQQEVPYVRTPEHNARVAEANRKRLKGTKFSDEHRAKMSAAHMGKPSPRKGIKMSEEQKAKISASLRASKLKKSI
jgi:hypothetical protein